MSQELVVLTGATKGLGRALAVALVAGGHRVVALGRDRDALASLPDESGAPELVTTIAADLASREGLAGAVHDVRAATAGGASVLINNAALQHFASVDELALDAFEETLFVNTFVPFALAQALLPELEASNGTIVNVASDLAYRPSVGGAAYVASKWGLAGMSHVLQEEVRSRGVRVCVLEPGWIATGPEAERRARESHMAPAELAEVVTWILDAPAGMRIDRLTVHPMVQGSWG
jgi:NAD(P)-dependent dehydrogenase (short-subunit alcohol dehydrogenase family)